METRCSTIAALILAFCVFVASDSIIPKPGHCPPVLPESFAPLPPCNYDSDCQGDDKCCVYFSTAVCVPPISVTLDCPVNQGGFGLCVELCSSDDDCYNPGERCCFNGCGHECRQSVPVKPGSCGSSQFTPRCYEHCEHDGNCRGSLKCCPSNCGGSVCSNPIYTF